MRFTKQMQEHNILHPAGSYMHPLNEQEQV